MSLLLIPSLIHLFDWSGLIDKKKGLGETFQVPNLETGKMEKLITGDDAGALTANEEEQFRNMVNRLHTIFKYAKNQNVRVMVDAEQSYFQPAIHRLEHGTLTTSSAKFKCFRPKIGSHTYLVSTRRT